MGIVSQQSFKITMDKKEAKKFMTLLHSLTPVKLHTVCLLLILFMFLYK